MSLVSHKKRYLDCVELTNFRIFTQPIPIPTPNSNFKIQIKVHVIYIKRLQLTINRMINASLRSSVFSGFVQVGTVSCKEKKIK